MRYQVVMTPMGWMTSYTTGPDSVCLNALIQIHAPNDDPYILDATYGHGAMWDGCAYRPDLAMDIRPLPGVTLQDDFTVMAGIANESVDVIVFDPPHLPNAAASEHSSRIWWDRYGIMPDDLRKGDNVCAMFLPFLHQAARVLVPNGIVLAKIADIVHNHRHQWQGFAFIKLCPECGLTACDLMIRADPKGANLKSPTWENQKHTRTAHVYWIVARKGGCERP